MEVTFLLELSNQEKEEEEEELKVSAGREFAASSCA